MAGTQGRRTNVSARAARSTYVVFAVLTGHPCILFALIILRRGFRAFIESGFGAMLLICVAAMMFAFYWISRFRLEIDDRAITYSRLFGGTVELPFDRIRRAALHIIHSSHGQAVKLFIEQESAPPVLMNIKVFSLDAVAELFAAIEERSVRIEVPNEWYPTWIYRKALARRPFRSAGAPRSRQAA